MPYYQTPDGYVFDLDFAPHGAVKLSQAKGKQARKEQAIKGLQAMLADGTTVYCILRHVSSSGMSRRISLAYVEGGEIQTFDMQAADAIDWRIGEKEGVIVSGCGMDMGFHLVETLGRVIGRSLKHRWL